MSNRAHHPTPLRRMGITPVPSVGIKRRKHKSGRHGGRHAKRQRRALQQLCNGVVDGYATDTRTLERIAAWGRAA